MIPMELWERFEDWLWDSSIQRNKRGHRLFKREWGPFIETLEPWQKTIFLENVKHNSLINNRRDAAMLIAAYISGIAVGAMFGLDAMFTF